MNDVGMDAEHTGHAVYERADELPAPLEGDFRFMALVRLTEAATETADVAAAVQAEADASWGYAVVVLLATLILGEVFRRCTRSAPAAAARDPGHRA